MNKKNKKEKMSDSVAEGVIELILGIILFGVGALVCLFISKVFSLKIEDFDFDLCVLIGIAFLALVVLAISLIKMFVKKNKNQNKQ